MVGGGGQYRLIFFNTYIKTRSRFEFYQLVSLQVKDRLCGVKRDGVCEVTNFSFLLTYLGCFTSSKTENFNKQKILLLTLYFCCLERVDVDRCRNSIPKHILSIPSKLTDFLLFLLLRRMAGNAQAAVGSAVGAAVNKAQSAAVQAATQAAAKEVEKQMSNAFSAALGGRKF